MKHFYYVTLVGKIGSNEFEKDFNTTSEALKFVKKFNVTESKITSKEAWSNLGKIARNW